MVSKKYLKVQLHLFNVIVLASAYFDKKALPYWKITGVRYARTLRTLNIGEIYGCTVRVKIPESNLISTRQHGRPKNLVTAWVP